MNGLFAQQWVWYVLMLLAAGVLASSHASAKASLEFIGLKKVLFFRALAAATVSLPLLWVAKFYRPLDAKDVASIGLAVLLSPILLNVFYFIGLRTGQLGVQNALRQNSPLAVIALQAMIWSTPLVPIAYVGVSMILVGTVWLALESKRTGSSAAAFASGIVAAVIHGSSIVAQSYALACVNPPGLIVIQNFAFLIFTVLLCGGELRGVWRDVGVDKRLRKGAFYAAISGLGINFVYDGIKLLAMPVIGPAAVACLTLASLPISVWLGRWIFGERPGLKVYLLITMILVGALLLSLVIEHHR